LVVVRLGLSRVHEGMNALLAGLVERLSDADPALD
jgi:hypothetical protein